MNAGSAALPAVAFDGQQANACNVVCAWPLTTPVKFLDLLNKPVSFRWRSTSEAVVDNEAASADAGTETAAATATVANAHGFAPARTEGISDSACPNSLRHVVTPAPDEHVALLSRHIDEAALLFATEQPDAAIALLSTALSTASTPASATERRAWWMLLELHEATGQQAGFDRAALGYAQRFEASPPQWRVSPTRPRMSVREAPAALPLMLSLRDRLGAGAQPTLAQWQQRSTTATELMLDLSSVPAIELAGCHLLLSLLTDWQQQGVQVQLRPCDALLAMLRALIQSGRRDEDDAGWRLLMELLRLAGDVERYEDACLAYSLTYEMSPPAAPPPVVGERSQMGAASRCTMPQAMPPQAARPGLTTSLAFTLPELVTMPIDGLLVALRAHVRQSAASTQALVLDAQLLQRIDFHAASALQASLTELAAGKPVEWQGVSFLVSTLLQLTCGNAMPKIINRQP